MTYETLANQSRQLREQNSQLKRVLGEINPNEWMVLGIVHEAPTRITKIAEYLECSLAHATNSVNRLEVKGLVSRSGDGQDQRAKVVTFIGNEEWFNEIERQVKAAL
jgi:DNA-binding MarR family transcriptional regulator